MRLRSLRARSHWKGLDLSCNVHVTYVMQQGQRRPQVRRAVQRILTTGDLMVPAVTDGLYDSRFEHDACGVGFVADLSARGGHDVVASALRVLCNLEHRGAAGAHPHTRDGAGHLPPPPGGFFPPANRATPPQPRRAPP